MKKAVVVDLGGSKARVSLVDEKWNVFTNPGLTRKLARDKGDKGLTAQILSMIYELLRGFKAIKGGIVGIGIGSAGIIDGKSLTINDAPNLSDIIKRITFPSELKKRFKVPVLMLNDTSAGALASYYFGYGKGKNHKVVVYLTI